MADAEPDEGRASIKRWLRFADELLRRRNPDVVGKTGGTAQRGLSREEVEASRRLGAVLVEDGVLTPAQLALAVERQEELAGRGEVRTLGEIAVYMGLVTPDELDAAIARLFRGDVGK